jgi:hypothetical protein
LHPPELRRHCSLLEQHACYAQHGLIMVFYNTILLWSVWSKEVTLDTFIGVVSRKLFVGELPVKVVLQHIHWYYYKSSLLWFDVGGTKALIKLSKMNTGR